jgi:hypothetical protein
MDGKAWTQNPGNLAKQGGGARSSLKTVKVTLQLSVETAQRLGVESAMRRISQAAIAEEVLGAYLSRWELPTVTGSNGA